MNVLIKRNRDVEALEIAAGRQGADRGSVVTLATRLAASYENAEGYRIFSELAASHPGAVFTPRAPH
jgi:hypothetical protein